MQCQMLPKRSSASIGLESICWVICTICYLCTYQQREMLRSFWRHLLILLSLPLEGFFLKSYVFTHFLKYTFLPCAFEEFWNTSRNFSLPSLIPPCFGLLVLENNRRLLVIIIVIRSRGFAWQCIHYSMSFETVNNAQLSHWPPWLFSEVFKHFLWKLKCWNGISL